MPASLPISILDLVVIGVVIISALLAAVRGFTREQRRRALLRVIVGIAH